MLDRKTLPKQSTESLTKLLSDLIKQDKAARLANFGLWRDAGFVLAEVKERHLAGKLGSGSWAAYCKKLGVTRSDADLYITASEAEDPAAFIEDFYTLEELREERRATGNPGKATIIIKSPGVIFGYITALNAVARRELWALCWRMYGPEIRRVGDELGWDDETGDIARPRGTA